MKNDMTIPCTPMTKVEIRVVDPNDVDAEPGDEWKKLLPPDHPLSLSRYPVPMIFARLHIGAATGIPDLQRLRPPRDWVEGELRNEIARYLYGEIHTAAREAVRALHEIEREFILRARSVFAIDTEPFKQAYELLRAFERYGLDVTPPTNGEPKE